MNPRSATNPAAITILAVFDTGLMDPKQRSALRRDLLRSPWWLPDHLDIGFNDTRQIENFVSCIGRDGCAHTAALRGERHLHFDASAVCQSIDMHVIDKTKIDDIDGNLGIVTRLQ